MDSLTCRNGSSGPVTRKKTRDVKSRSVTVRVVVARTFRGRPPLVLVQGCRPVRLQTHVGPALHRQEVAAVHHLGSGRNGSAGLPVASVSNRYTSPAAGSALRCSSLHPSVAVVTYSRFSSGPAKAQDVH